MIKVIFTLPSGLPSYVAVPGTPDAYIDGQTYGDCVARMVDTSVEDTVILSSWFWNGTDWDEYSTSPGEAYTLDTNTLSWVIAPETINKTYTKVIQDIKNLREAKDIEDITYTGKVLQVDVKSQNNITGKLDALMCHGVLNLTVDPATLFWRDRANVTHWWTDVTEYANWIRGLIIAYSDRRGALYFRSWEHGAAVKAIYDNGALAPEDKLQALLAYDITTGW